jgi:hypothetical protein
MNDHSNPARASHPSQSGESSRTAPFQFHLSTLFIVISGACILFAMISYWGFGGFLERVFAVTVFAGILSPFIELYHWWKENVEILRGEERK